jgi:hypothetical protein
VSFVKLRGVLEALWQSFAEVRDAPLEAFRNVAVPLNGHQLERGAVCRIKPLRLMVRVVFLYQD